MTGRFENKRVIRMTPTEVYVSRYGKRLQFTFEDTEIEISLPGSLVEEFGSGVEHLVEEYKKDRIKELEASLEEAESAEAE